MVIYIYIQILILSGNLGVKYSTYICGEGGGGERGKGGVYKQIQCKNAHGKNKDMHQVYIYIRTYYWKSQKGSLESCNRVTWWSTGHLLCRAGQGNLISCPQPAVCCISSQHNGTGLYLHCCLLWLLWQTSGSP